MRDMIAASVAKIRSITDVRPEIALILGSGLGGLAEEIDGVEIPYAEIPHFPVSTAPSHAGALVVGTLYGRKVVAMRGRVHLYEGYTPQETTYPMRVMAALGAHTAVLTNAAGGLQEDMQVGDVVVIDDQLSLPIACGMDPLIGKNDPEIGERFVSMNQAYAPELIRLVREIAPEVKQGAYAHVSGPSFEPPALIRMFRNAGCRVVGMSTAPEVVVARHMGVRVMALSAVTNIAVASVESQHVTNADEVWEAIQVVAPKIRKILEAAIPRI